MDLGEYFNRRGEGDRNGNSRGNENYEFYEDTHDGGGEYTARLRNFQRENSSPAGEGRYSSQDDGRYSGEESGRFAPRDGGRGEGVLSAFNERSERPARDGAGQQAMPRNFQNIMVYEPRTADDVQTLIDFLKTRESAIINLDKASPAIAQRVLDFVSGAMYALSGSVHRVAGNIFLLSPEGVGITNSYDNKNAKR